MRIFIALGVFLLMINWEYFGPRIRQKMHRKKRWITNLGLAIFNALLMRVTIGGLAYLSAIHAAEQSWGLLHQVVLPVWVDMTITLLLLDFAIYWQHVISHKWQVLWRLHQVHHTDLRCDASTAVRFHPLEIILSMFYKVVCIYGMGANYVAVIAFEIILNASATFNHSNIHIPPKINTLLSWIIITPDTHRIHHSMVKAATDSNYGFSISCWDRLFKTYRVEPQENQLTLNIGLPEYRQQTLRFTQLLRLPFSRHFLQDNKTGNQRNDKGE